MMVDSSQFLLRKSFYGSSWTYCPENIARPALASLDVEARTMLEAGEGCLCPERAKKPRTGKTQQELPSSASAAHPSSSAAVAAVSGPPILEKLPGEVVESLVVFVSDTEACLLSRTAKALWRVCLNEMRRRYVERLAARLNVDADVAGKMHTAKAIEKEIFATSRGPKEYRQKLRQVSAGLRQNLELCSSILQGAISPSELCSMRSEDMANRHVSQRRRSDRAEGLERSIRRPSTQNVTRMYMCDRCHKSEAHMTYWRRKNVVDRTTLKLVCIHCRHMWEA
ncbi:unnamed protein product [Vitrella brassicaformis CCMP3155]|uniref:TFIIS central domain-containing protein n=2 Tax=Vitrella brassicaformis TaxID=1169539 RepID=A0A0G4H6Z8_VITBC|nr:unnamed protein product [Vitrella brassicaformis CCMP3155]|eukprot:CEM39476.1 unnamed protein product [Vitrella brassicaformis CCMP3155]